MVPESDRLRPLHVRVAGHDGVRLGLGEGEDDERKRVDRLTRLGARVEHVEAKRGGDLIVPRPARMDLAADVPEQPLDRRVHVLVGIEVGGRILGDLRKASLDLVELFRRQ